MIFDSCTSGFALLALHVGFQPAQFPKISLNGSPRRDNPVSLPGGCGSMKRAGLGNGEVLWGQCPIEMRLAFGALVKNT